MAQQLLMGHPMKAFRPAAWLLAMRGFLPTAGGCTVSGSSETCNCPDTGIWPLVVIEPTCPVAPEITLTGVCAGTEGTQGGEIVFGANGNGSCHVQLLFADGSTYATDVEFTSEWLACGSNPHGCGDLITPMGLLRAPDRPSLALLSVASYCSTDDAGGGDATPE